MLHPTRRRSELKGLRIHAHVGVGLPVIRSDARRISQILGNLLSNAVKYTDAGDVSIGAEVRRDLLTLGTDTVSVAVRDTGPGIPAKSLPLVFAEFTRLEPRQVDGAGPGLAISQRLAHALGGSIYVESEVGAGSTFTLALPLENVETVV